MVSHLSAILTLLIFIFLLIIFCFLHRYCSITYIHRVYVSWLYISKNNAVVEEVTQLLKSKTTPLTFHFTLHVTLKLEKKYHVPFRLRWLCSLLGLVLGSVTLILVSNNQILFLPSAT